MKKKNEAVEQEVYTEKANTENMDEKQQQLPSLMENNGPDANDDESDENSRVFPGVL